MADENGFRPGGDLGCADSDTTFASVYLEAIPLRRLAQLEFKASPAYDSTIANARNRCGLLAFHTDSGGSFSAHACQSGSLKCASQSHAPHRSHCLVAGDRQGSSPRDTPWQMAAPSTVAFLRVGMNLTLRPSDRVSSLRELSAALLLALSAQVRPRHRFETRL